MSSILTDFGIDWHLVFVSVVNFSVLAVILWYVMIKPLVAVLEQREATIRSSLERAELERQEAKLLETQVADDRKQATERAGRIIADAEAKAATIVKHASTNAEAKAATILTDAKKRAVSDRDQLMNDATRQLADVVIHATQLVVGETMTASIDRALVTTALHSVKKSS